MFDCVFSSWKQLLQVMGKMLQLISIDNGYLIDVGVGWILELKFGDQDMQIVLMVVIEKQQWVESFLKINMYWFIIVSVIVKVFIDIEGYQQVLDDLVIDIEVVMDSWCVVCNFFDGIQVLVYVGMELLMLEKVSVGWVGVLIIYQIYIFKK